MSARSVSRRGKPIVVLAGLLACWCMVRAMTWESMDFRNAPAPFSLAGNSATQGSGTKEDILAAADGLPQVSQDSAAQNIPVPFASPARPPAPLPPIGGEARPIPEWSRPDEQPVDPRVHMRNGPGDKSMRPSAAAGHNMMLAAAFSQSIVPPELMAYFMPGSPLRPPAKRATGFAKLRDSQEAVAPSRELLATPRGNTRRWSFDAWAFWREDTTTPITSGRPSYGRSQAGGILRYRPWPGSRWQPAIHLRTSWALDGAREREVALGASARPLPSVPVAIAAEARYFDGSQGSEVRPAAYAVTQMPPAELPLGLRGEVYAAGGYVGGRNATAFVDGQARVDRRVIGLTDNAEFRLGAGTWGGAQAEGGRLDVGPTASLPFSLGRISGRASADYRLRVAGDAEPASGPAITVSIGF